MAMSDRPHVKTDINHASAPDLNIVRINLAIFSLFTALVFSYFVFFSHQFTEAKAEINAKILEINAIDPPQPWSFMTIPASTEYYYLKRKEQLLDEFRAINESLQKATLTKQRKAEYGSSIQAIITQLAYFFPFKRMLDFKKDGTVTFDSNNYESIQNVENLDENVPPYAKQRNLPRSYNTEFIKKQIDETNHIHRRLTMELKDGKEKIIEAMILANGLNNEYDKTRLKKYIDSLIVYLENHRNLMMPLGLAIIKSEIIQKAYSKSLIFFLSLLLTMNFLSGVILPLFVEKYRTDKKYWPIPLIIFVIGIITLFSSSIYSLPG